jgi:hypothetical protein
MKSRNESRNALLIEQKLKKYIRRYYHLKIAYGLLTVLISVLASLLFSFLVNEFLEPGIITLRILVFALGAGNLFLLIWLVFIPVMRRTGWLKGLNYHDASKAISARENSVKDNIDNILELEREKIPENVLYDFAIDQKSEKIKWIDFNRTISLKSILKQGVRAGITIITIVLIYLIWPDFISKGYQNVIQGNSSVNAVISYEFEILNKELKVESGKDFELQFRITPEVKEALIKTGEKSERALWTGSYYSYTFKAVNNPINFRISTGNSLSRSYTLQILQRPEVSKIILKVSPPLYTGISDFIQENEGNIEIPEGSAIQFDITTLYCEDLKSVFVDTASVSGSGQNWSFKKVFGESLDYSLVLEGRENIKTEYYYRATVVKDLFPEIEIKERIDSTAGNQVIVEGAIQDDFGFSRLVIVEETKGNEKEIEIKIAKDLLFQGFYQVIEPDTNETAYFFRVWDNDGINGPKFTDSRKIYLKTRTKSEIKEENRELGKRVNEKIEEGVSAIDKLEEKIMQFRMERLAGSLKPWEIQEKMKEINQMKNDLMDMIEALQKENEEFTDNEEILGEKEEIVEKAKEIEDLLKNLIDDELKELLEQFEKLAKEFNEREANEATEKLELNMEKLKEQMDMGLEMLKKMAVEKNLMEAAQGLEELAKKMEEEKQDSVGEKVKEEFKEWENKFEETIKENESLKEPMKIEDKKEARENIRKDLDKSTSGSKNEKSENAKNAAKKMKDLANDIRNMMEGAQDASQMVDVEELRQIRNSLNEYSKKQESVNQDLSNVTTANPIFAENIREQKFLQEKFGKIRDSLKSIGYKEPIVAKIIGEEMFHVETSFRSLFQSFETNRIQQIRVEQNRIMSEINIMVLKLDELIKSAENQKGTGSGTKGFTDSKRKDKGEEKGSEQIGNTREKQESLKEQLKSAIQQMKQGANGKQGRKELSKMLGEREMMRRATERLAQEGMLGKDAKERLQQAIEMMKEVERDIIYNRIGDYTAEKDEWIRTRLLEAENAERERENENRRESREFKGDVAPNTIKLVLPEDENKPYRQSLKYRELKLKKYYQDKYDEYLKSAIKK